MTFTEFTLSAADFLVTHVPGNDFQDWLFCHLPKVKGEADQPVVHWVHHLPLLESRSDVLLSSVFGSFSQLGSIKDCQE